MSDCIPWNHPLDIHFAVRSPLGWPKLVLQIHKLDEVFYFMIVPILIQHSVAWVFALSWLWILPFTYATRLFGNLCMLLATYWFNAG